MKPVTTEKELLGVRLEVCFLGKVYDHVRRRTFHWGWPFMRTEVKRWEYASRIEGDLRDCTVFTKAGGHGTITEGQHLELYNGFFATVVGIDHQYAKTADVTAVVYSPEMNPKDNRPESLYSQFLELMKFAGWEREHKVDEHFVD